MAKHGLKSKSAPDLAEIVRCNVSEHELFRSGERILVGVSGGVDSVVLLQLLHGLAVAAGWSLAVAHLNHGVRGRDAANDARFVKALAKRLGLAYFEGRANTTRLARRNGCSLEMAGRQARHEFFAATARKHRCSCVALAHHADDQLELFFIRLFRGSAEGLAGMKWTTSFPGLKSLKLARPLLNVSKAELTAYARRRGLAWREDRTNIQTVIKRNRIRHQLLPLIRAKYQPGIDAVLQRMMDVLGAESDFIKAQAQQWLRKPRPRFGKLPVALQRRVLQLQLMRKGIIPDFKVIESLRKLTDHALDVSKQQATGQGRVRGPNDQGAHQASSGIRVARDSSGKVYTLPAVAEPATGEIAPLEVELGYRGKATFCGRCVRWGIRDARGPLKAHDGPSKVGGEQFDAARVGDKIVLRHWRPGDRFQPIGMTKPVKLQDLFTNAKIPREKRRRLLVASSMEHGIFWVEGLRIAEPFKITDRTRRRLTWYFERT